MNELFKLPERLPKSLGKIPMFRATRFASLSSRDEKYTKDLARRLRAAQKRFGLNGEPVSEGARFVLRSEQTSVEIYAASDSLWWTDHRLAYQERPARGRLPDEAGARSWLPRPKPPCSLRKCARSCLPSASKSITAAPTNSRAT